MGNGKTLSKSVIKFSRNSTSSMENLTSQRSSGPRGSLGGQNKMSEGLGRSESIIQAIMNPGSQQSTLAQQMSIDALHKGNAIEGDYKL
jgi:hypothetical protein